MLWLVYIQVLQRVLALYDPFGVDVPLNLNITHSLTQHVQRGLYNKDRKYMNEKHVAQKAYSTK